MQGWFELGDGMLLPSVIGVGQCAHGDGLLLSLSVGARLVCSWCRSIIVVVSLPRCKCGLGKLMVT